MSAVQMVGITKRFGALTALDQVDLTVRAGSIHALVGENGAGKTTLVRILYGAVQAEAGQVKINEKLVALRSPREAISAGVGMVSQHYSIIPELSCLQNLMLGAEPGPWLFTRQAEARASSLAAQMGFVFDWQSPAAQLSPAGAQKLEILKLLWREASIMILDEPTAMLSPADSDALFASLALLSRKGATVILVTHRLPEVMEFCEQVTILRSGKRVAEFPVSQTTVPELAQAIIGHEFRNERILASSPQQVCLDIRDLTVTGAQKEDALQGLNLRVRAGEIVGIAGVDGNGQRELFAAICGTATVQKGQISFFGEEVTRRRPAERIARGLRLIPEDRLAEGVIEEWSLEENAALGLQRLPAFRNGSQINIAGRRQFAQRVADKFQTKHSSLKQPFSSLSGGNQQRFVAARCLASEPKLVLAFQPSRGLDIEGSARIFDALRAAAHEGAAVLVVSFDLDELLAECDRIVVISGGKIYQPAEAERSSRQAIGLLMVGGG